MVQIIKTFRLEKRQVKEIIIEVYKIMLSVEELDREIFFSISYHTRTKNGEKLLQNCEIPERQLFFKQRIINCDIL